MAAPNEAAPSSNTKPAGEPRVAEYAAAHSEGEEQEAEPACPVPQGVIADNARLLADEFFARGKALWTSGKLANACECLQNSDRLAPGRGGTMLALGLCREEQGRLGLAYRELQNARAKAREDGRSDREELAVQHLRALEPRLAWLTVVSRRLEGAAEGRFWLDGMPIRIEGPALPLELGTHVLKVELPGFVTQELSVELTQPGERRTLEIPSLERRAAASKPGGEGTTSHSVPSSGNPERARAARVEPRRAAASPTSSPASSTLAQLKPATLALGIVGVAVSLGAGAWALERKATVHAECDAAKQCTDKGLSAVSTGRTLIVVGTTAFAVGAVSLGAWVLLPSSGTSNSARVVLSGVF
ncbi:MAG TPA: hypothetical protein VFQ61_23405 [Polyangiaceae bacterium]|nr:hypothetical protein [Polyangiaceae bacterium]